MAEAAIVGVGYTELTRASQSSVLDLAYRACAAAVEDAGMSRAEVDGVASFMVMNDSVTTQAVATVLGLAPLRYSLDLNLGGQAPCHLVWQAATAVATGQANAVLVFRSMNGRSGARVGGMEFSGDGGQYRYPIGYGAYMMYVGMWARRFLYETGQDELDLAGVALAAHACAEANPRAFRREPLTLESYLAAPYVVDPYRAPDCTVEVDGACAVLVTSLERARDLRHRPAVLAAGGYRAGPRPGLDIGDHFSWLDYTRNYTSWIRDDLYGRAGLSTSDIQFAELYDCFSSTTLMALEGLGLCERGGSGELVRSGATAVDGALPVNTNGGLLCEGYLHGMNTVAEAALQIQGRCGDRQVPRHDVCVVTSGALMDGSALIVVGDR